MIEDIKLTLADIRQAIVWAKGDISPIKKIEMKGCWIEFEKGSPTRMGIDKDYQKEFVRMMTNNRRYPDGQIIQFEGIPLTPIINIDEYEDNDWCAKDKEVCLKGTFALEMDDVKKMCDLIIEDINRYLIPKGIVAYKDDIEKIIHNRCGLY